MEHPISDRERIYQFGISCCWTAEYPYYLLLLLLLIIIIIIIIIMLIPIKIAISGYPGNTPTQSHHEHHEQGRKMKLQRRGQRPEATTASGSEIQPQIGAWNLLGSAGYETD